MAVHQLIPHGEVLGQTHHGVVDGTVSMGMVFTQHVTHAGGGLFKGLVGGQILLVHGVQNTPVHRLQAVAHIGQGTGYDDAHGVLNVAVLHLLDELGFGNDLIREGDVLRFIITIMCHKINSLLINLPLKGKGDRRQGRWWKRNSFLKCRCLQRTWRSARSTPAGERPPRP